ncbi:MAG: iron ABC transporter permease [Candidatus Eremiobacteraeota bacterium]|nr:iron ABC transporter permease [Candidatus Eremiobacteraeota bacterium]
MPSPAGARTLAVLSAVAAASLVVAVFVGGSPLPAGDVAYALLHPSASGDAHAIVWTLRLPRVVIAGTVGVALAVAGFLLQGMLRNPLVDPFLTGVSAGAAAAIAIGVGLGVAAPFLPALGFVAGLGTALLVALLARRGTGIDAERLILAGVSLSALFSAIVSLALTKLARNGADQILAWIAGSVAGRGWTDLLWTLPYVVAGLAGALLAVPSLNALRLGHGVARAVGVDVARAQWLLLGATTLLTAAAVSLSGIVGFVGLIVPHLARRVTGTDGRSALPASALIGLGLVPLADALGRSLMPPSEIPLGVLLAFIGVPTFLYLYLRPAGAARLWGT